jgi:hypothetical protein
MNARTRFLGCTPLHVGKTTMQLLQRPMEAALESEIGERTRSRDEERANLLLAELGESAAISLGKHDTAVYAAFCVDGNARGTERIDVAIDRPLRDFEPLRKHARRTLPARLQQQQKRNEAIGFHDSIKPRKT